MHINRRYIVDENDNPKEVVILLEDFKPEEEERIYAMVAGKPQVVTVKKNILEDLPGTKDEIKEKGEKDGEKKDLGSNSNTANGDG